MADTVKIANKKDTLVIAHRGASCLERENTLAAFIAAGNRSYFGIETDVHVTKDGKLVIMHDSDTSSRDISAESRIIEESYYGELENIRLLDTDGEERSDLHIPLYTEYLKICRRYGKKAVVELKGDFTNEALDEFIRQTGSTDDVIFISFSRANIANLRKKIPQANLQLLTMEIDSGVLSFLTEYGADIDVCGLGLLNEEKKGLDISKIEAVRRIGKKINVWTIDRPEHAAMLTEAGVDMITSNCLE